MFLKYQKYLNIHTVNSQCTLIERMNEQIITGRVAINYQVKAAVIS